MSAFITVLGFIVLVAMVFSQYATESELRGRIRELEEELSRAQAARDLYLASYEALKK